VVKRAHGRGPAIAPSILVLCTGNSNDKHTMKSIVTDMLGVKGNVFESRRLKEAACATTRAAAIAATGRTAAGAEVTAAAIARVMVIAAAARRIAPENIADHKDKSNEQYNSHALQYFPETVPGMLVEFCPNIV